MPISNVIGDVVKGAGSILSNVFKGGTTPTGGGIFGGYGQPGPSIYETGDYIF